MPYYMVQCYYGSEAIGAHTFNVRLFIKENDAYAFSDYLQAVVDDVGTRRDLAERRAEINEAVSNDLNFLDFDINDYYNCSFGVTSYEAF